MDGIDNGEIKWEFWLADLILILLSGHKIIIKAVIKLKAKRICSSFWLFKYGYKS